VQAVEFFINPSYNCLSIKFQDSTSLSFEIDTGFTLEADFSQWKSGDQHVIRASPPIKSS